MMVTVVHRVNPNTEHCKTTEGYMFKRVSNNGTISQEPLTYKEARKTFLNNNDEDYYYDFLQELLLTTPSLPSDNEPPNDFNPGLLNPIPCNYVKVRLWDEAKFWVKTLTGETFVCSNL